MVAVPIWAWTLVALSLICMTAVSAALSLPGYLAFKKSTLRSELTELNKEIAELKARVDALEAERNEYILENEKLRLATASKDYALQHVVEGIEILTKQIGQLSKGKAKPAYSIEAVIPHLPPAPIS